jgi:GTP-binding protein
VGGARGAPDRHRGHAQEGAVQEKLEKLSVADALHAIDFAEWWCCCSTRPRDSRAGPQIADRVLQEGRALIIALNKWDVAENASSLFNGVKAALDEGLAQVKGVPLLTVSGDTARAPTRC